MRYLVLITVSILMIATTMPSAADSIWSGTLADQMISYDDDEYARAVQIFLSSNENLHIFWSEDAPSVREIHYGRAANLYANEWTSTSADRVISFPDGYDVMPEECDVTQHPYSWDEPILVVWSEETETGREIHYGISTDEGETWSSETADMILSDPATTENTSNPSAVCDQNGTFHVVWHQPTPGGGPAEILYSRSTDGGDSWTGTSGDRIISFADGNGAITPHIVADGDYLAVVWRETGDSGDPAIHLGISADGGDTWSSETADREISQTAQLMTDLAAATERCWDGGIHVVYSATYDTSSPYYYEIYSTSSYDHGATWDGESQLIPVSYDEGAGRSASNPDLFVGVNQGVIAVWNEADDLSGSAEQHISRLQGQWTGATADEIISFPDGENGYRPSITGANCWIPANGPRDVLYDTFVAWTEFAGGSPDNYEVHLSAVTMISNAVEDETRLAPSTLTSMPNPGGESIRIEWDLPVAADVTIEIFDPSGRRVRSFHRPGATGPQSLHWDRKDVKGTRLASGLYFARIRTPYFTQSIPIVLL